MANRNSDGCGAGPDCHCALTQQLPPKQVTEKLVRGPVCIDQVKPGLSSFARVRGHQQVTDVYLLALALSRTFSPVRPLP